MTTVTSRDGTRIAFERTGHGPALVLVSPATGLGADYASLAELLAPDFTAYAYDRRGRGGSSDIAPYAPSREFEDIEAIIDAAGGTAFLYGLSSGAILALDAANALAGKVTKLALYEPPFIINTSHPPLPADYVEHLNELIAAGRRSDAVEYFMTAAIGIPAEYLAQMKQDPMWPAMERVAHTIAYDGTIVRDVMRGEPLPRDRWPAVTIPTLAMAGGNSEAFFHDGARAVVDILPNAQFRVLEGQDHGVAPEALAPMLKTFFFFHE